MKYSLVSKQQKRFPPEATQDEITALCERLGLIVDVMTDQIDIRRPSGRKVATYMAGA